MGEPKGTQEVLCIISVYLPKSAMLKRSENKPYFCVLTQGGFVTVWGQRETPILELVWEYITFKIQRTTSHVAVVGMKSYIYVKNQLARVPCGGSQVQTTQFREQVSNSCTSKMDSIVECAELNGNMDWQSMILISHDPHTYSMNIDNGEVSGIIAINEYHADLNQFS